MKPYSIEQAKAFVTDGLRTKKWIAGDTIPSLAELARLAGVSAKTMWSAVDALKREGVLLSRKGARLRIGVPEATKPAEPSQMAGGRTSSERVRTLIERDIFSGHFPAGSTIASLKVLRSRYGSSHATIRKAITRLCDDGIVVPYGRTFRVPRIEKRLHRNSVCLVWEVGSFEEFKRRSERENQIIDSVERECHMAGIALHFIEFNVDDLKVVSSVHAKLKKFDDAMGYIIHPIAYFYDALVNKRYAELLALCLSHKKPCTVVDEIGLFRLPETVRPNPLYKVFKIADEGAGRSVGRFLLALGHRRVAFITHAQQDAWSADRLAGIEREFRNAGIENAVSAFGFEYPLATVESILRQPDLTKEQIEQIFPDRLEDAAATPKLEAMVQRFTPYLKSRKKEIDNLKHDARLLADLAGRNMSSSTMRYVRDNGMYWINNTLVRILMQSIFEEALADPTITAWVTVNDNAAGFARSFLHERQVKVPEKISLLSFDNLPKSSEADISSYDFDVQNLMRQTLAFVGRPDRVPRPARQSYVETEGFVIQRASTGRAPARGY